ncbi:MAG: hypothetical protein KJ718_02125 [Nanoarchaeota archaeon]|nr:hypothetical protein [Nanoarchaeota archaeon]
MDNNIEFEENTVTIKNIVIDDANTSKILRDIAENKREDFIKKAIIIGAIGLKNLYLAENVDYIEKEFKELLKNSESQSKDIRNALEREFRELLKNSEIQSKDIKNNLEKEFRDLLKASESQSNTLLRTSENQAKDIWTNFEKGFKELLRDSENQSKDIQGMIEKQLDVENNQSSLGKMRLLFEDYFDKKKGKIGELLNPFEESSPIKKLKDEILGKIQELRDEVLKEKSKEEIIEKTSLKGANFEEIVLEQAQDFLSEYEDKVNACGECLGRTNKIGDLIVDINGDEKKRIVIECKDSSSYSHKKTIDEINDAIENRSAKYGIFLFKSQSQIPSALKPMKITNNYIVTSFDDYGLYFSLRVARLFVEKNGESKQEIPIDKIQKVVEELQTKLSDFKNIQTKLTQIDNASSYIRENIDRLKKDLDEGLSSVKELISA